MTKLTGLQSEIMKQLNQYNKVLNEDVQQAQQETANELVDTLRTKSPELTGSYQSGWRIKKEKKKLVIHNKTDYQLTHLLEHGHAKKNGGRVEAQIHIRPAEAAAIENYLQKIEQAIKQ